MDAGDVLAARVSGDDLGDDLVEMHRRGVADERAGWGGGDDLGGDQRAGIEADGAALDEALAAQRDEVGRAGAGADEVDGHVFGALDQAVPRGLAWPTAEGAAFT